MNARDSLIEVLVQSGYDLTGEARIGIDNEACRERAAELADQVIAGLAERGYVLKATNSEHTVRDLIEQNKRAVDKLLLRLNRRLPEDADELRRSADPPQSSGR